LLYDVAAPKAFAPPPPPPPFLKVSTYLQKEMLYSWNQMI
jgi:hypothetical protein